jgi:flagellar hook-associated protein 1 FlgK
LAVNPSIIASQIATIDPGPPSSSNGVALELANITNPTNSADMMSGESYTAFYGQLAGDAGAASSQNSANLNTQQDLVTQAQNQRSQASGVSLNDQAAQLMTLQQAYQATAKIITVLQAISQAAIDIIPQT